MNFNEITIVLSGKVLFFGFIAWMAFISTKNHLEEELNVDKPKNKFEKVRK